MWARRCSRDGDKVVRLKQRSEGPRGHGVCFVKQDRQEREEERTEQ